MAVLDIPKLAGRCPECGSEDVEVRFRTLPSGKNTVIRKKWVRCHKCGHGYPTKKAEKKPETPKSTKIKIIYCVPSGFHSNAESLKFNLQKLFKDKISIRLAEGKDGIFDVYLNNDLIFSKNKENRFPEIDEIKQRIQKNL